MGELAPGERFGRADLQRIAGGSKGRLQGLIRKMNAAGLGRLQRVVFPTPDGERIDITYKGGSHDDKLSREHYPDKEPPELIYERNPFPWNKCALEDVLFFSLCERLDRATRAFQSYFHRENEFVQWHLRKLLDTDNETFAGGREVGFSAHLRRFFHGKREPFLLLQHRPDHGPHCRLYGGQQASDNPAAAISGMREAFALGHRLFLFPFRHFIEPAMAALTLDSRGRPRKHLPNVPPARPTVSNYMELSPAEQTLINTIRRTGNVHEHLVQVKVTPGTGSIDAIEYKQRHAPHARQIPEFRREPHTSAVTSEQDHEGRMTSIVVSKRVTF